MNVLVTGGAGFIGSHLVEALITRGDNVRVLDNLSSGHLCNLDGLPLEFIQGDIRDFDTVCQAADGCDFVFHQAALVSVPLSIEDPKLNHDVNVTGTLHVFEAARRVGVKQVVYASSAAVYGDRPSLPVSENDRPCPISPYAVAKWMNEQMATLYNRQYGLVCVGLRYFNVFGPRQDSSSPYSGVLSVFCDAARMGKGVTIYGDGMQTRDFVYVRDVVAANLAAASLKLADETAPSIFNIGRGEVVSLRELVTVVERVGGRPLPITYAPPRLGDIRHSLADIRLAAQYLHYQPQTMLHEGIEQIFAAAH
ncbi:MAG: NAD-dependent epimerase/dehydratase family protein [Candidatus Promineifilaceae bacterium]